MATRLYFHSALSTEAGTLPLSEQSTKTAIQNYEAQTVNRTMDTSIGVAQATLSFVNTTNTANNTNYYVSKFVSPELNMTAIALNNWRYNFACKHSSLSVVDDYPTTDAATPVLPLCCYVWRPSTGVKVANIFDGTTTGYVDTGNYTGHATQQTTNEIAEDGTFSGAAVAGIQTGDVIIFEVWISVFTTTTTSVTLSWFYDGTTENLVDGTVVSNHASFLETPENLVFSGGPVTTTARLYKSFGNQSFMPSVASRTF